MRKSTLLTVMLVLVLCAVGLGFYRGWFVLSSHTDGGGKVDVNLSVDPDKAQADAVRVGDKARDMAGRPADGAPRGPADDGAKPKGD